MMQDKDLDGRSPADAGSGSQALPEAANASSPSVSIPNADGWIDHNGKGMPVSGYARVEIRCAGYGADTDIADAGVYQLGGPENDWWVRRGKSTDIIAYRVVSR